MPQTIPMLRRSMTGAEIEIHPVADMHVGSKEFDERAFGDFRRMVLEKENRYIVLAGDICDNAIKSSVSSVYEAVLQPREQRQYAAELLAPLKERILCAVSGNHEQRNTRESDTDPMEIVLAKLNTEHLYRPDMAYIYLQFPKPTDHCKQPPNYTILVTHGSAGGALIGAGLNRMEPFAMAMGCDLLITGHTHKPATAPLMRLVQTGKGVMASREIRIMTATGWLGYAGYPARKMMRPVPIAPNYAVLDGKRFAMRVVT